ncbi:MAG: yugI [Bacillales bacterium]|jgi:general stress protein 13|nr:yugI [Bacillales bacterium]
MGNIYECGQIVEGTVTGLQRYGVFISLDDDTQGLVHISEITNGFVKEITDFVKIGDVVKVRVISIDPVDGKIALTMRNDDPTTREMSRRVPRNNDHQLPKALPVETNSGFAPLREKLAEWIERSKE